VRLPLILRRQVLHFECAIEDAVRSFAESLEDGARVLDAGAGEGRYAGSFSRQRYTGVDFAVGDPAWDYSGLDAVCDLTALPFADRRFDAAVNIVTLEHIPEPASAIRELGRTLRPGAPLLLVVPFEWEVHQEPHDYFRFTNYGLEYLIKGGGFGQIEIRPVGGYFRLLSRRLLNGIRLCMSGPRWILFPAAVLFLGPPAIVTPWFDCLDKKQAFTLGYICVARKR
jgi:SAM-dependent methyltransferase